MTPTELRNDVGVETDGANEEHTGTDTNQVKVDAVHDTSYHPGTVMKFYCSPQQRQRWGETQVLPRVNYGDLFFDLFFVAGAYNVANILNDSPTPRGFLYFLGTFYPIMDVWRAALIFYSRFVIEDDIYHRVFEMGGYVVVATIILFVRTVDVLSNPRDHIDMFVFSCALAAFASALAAGSFELYFKAQGQRDAIKRVALVEFSSRAIMVGFYVAAAVISGLEFYGAMGQEDDHRMLAAAKESGTSGEKFSTDVPIWLCFIGSISSTLYFIIRVQFVLPNDGSHKKITIPINVDYMIHRDGEWIMLILGESVLSLLIVDVTDVDGYFITFYTGIIIVILLQYLHYSSQPHHANGHAVRRHKNAGVWWSVFNGIYSASLVCMGVAFKLFLYEFGLEERRFLGEEETLERYLAGASGAASLDPDVRRRYVAHIFSDALAMIFFCLDVMSVLHTGLKRGFDRCHCNVSKKTNKMGVVLVLLRAGLVAFAATLSQYETDPEHLALLGLLAVVIQLAIRQLGLKYFPEEHSHHHQPIHTKDYDDASHSAGDEEKGTENNIKEHATTSLRDFE